MISISILSIIFHFSLLVLNILIIEKLLLSFMWNLVNSQNEIAFENNQSIENLSKKIELIVQEENKLWDAFHLDAQKKLSYVSSHHEEDWHMVNNNVPHNDFNKNKSMVDEQIAEDVVKKIFEKME